MKQIFRFTSGTFQHSDSYPWTVYLQLTGNSRGAAPFQGNDYGAEVICPISTTLQNFHIELGVAPGTGESRTFTVVKNGVDTSLVVMISGSNTSGSDISSSVSVSPGDRLVVRMDASAAPLSSGMKFSLQSNSANSSEYWLGGNFLKFNDGIDRYSSIIGIQGASVGSSGEVENIVPHNTTANALYVRCSAAPGSGNNARFSIVKNGSREASSDVTISNTSQTGNVSGLSIGFTAGQTISILEHPSATLAAFNCAFGVAFTAETDGESFLPFSSFNTDQSTSATEYYPVVGGEVKSTTESNVRVTQRLNTQFKKLFTKLTGVAGTAGQYAFTLRKNGSNTALSSSIGGDVATTSSNTSDVIDISDGDTIDLSIAPSGTVTARRVRFSVVEYIPPAISRSLTDGVIISDPHRSQYDDHYVYDYHKFYDGSDPSYPLSRMALFRRSQADNQGIADVIDKVASAHRTTADSVGIADSIDRRLGWRRTQSDSIGVSDFIDFNLLGGVILRSIIDAVGVADTLLREVDFKRSQADQLGISDVCARQVDYDRSNSDAVGLLDTIYQFFIKHLALADSIGITDNLTQNGSYSRTANDNIGITDSLLRQVEYYRSNTENIGLTDFISNNYGVITRRISDSVGISESIIQASRFYRAQVDAEGISDFLKNLATFGVKIIDTVGVSDEATRNYIASRVASDGIGLSDFISFSRTQIDYGDQPIGEVVVLQPFPYTEPDRIVAYVVTDTLDTIVLKCTDISFSGKIYDSHTIYYKHTPYYSGNSSDEGPTFHSLEDL